MSEADNAKSEPQEELTDPFCLPSSPVILQFEDITSAAFKIKSGIKGTQCIRSHFSRLTGMEIYLKKEFLQCTGSFKERGARYALLMLSPEQMEKGVICASSGNFALALSYHGNTLNIPVTVVMSIVTPIMKIQRCRQYGATVVIQGNNIADARQVALRIGKERGLMYINGYDHPHVMAGQGTIGLEIMEQVKDIDAIVIPIGGGGVLAGVARAVKTLAPNVKIIGVEAEKCPSFTYALKARKPVLAPIDPSLADGLSVPMVGCNAFATSVPLIDRVVLVQEEWVAIAVLRMAEVEKSVVEGAGAATLAAVLAGHLDDLKGKRVVLLASGGNIDTTILGRCLERGLAADGRLLKFTVTVSDRPGGVAELCRLLASLGVSIKDMLQERAWIKSDIFSVAVSVVCETQGTEHATQLKKALEENFQKVVFCEFPMPRNLCKL